MSAQALNVGCICRVAPSEAQITSDAGTAMPSSSLEDLASEYGFSSDELVLAAEYEDVNLWTASNASTTYLFTSDESDYVTAAGTSNDNFADRAISVRNTAPGSDGVNRTYQFVLTDDAHEADVASVEGLSGLGNNLFVDTAATDRTEDQITTFGADGVAQARGATEASSTSGYGLVLSGSE
ncbi:hypothetical protein C5E16_10910 [Clavibacter michiganensis]|uniref:Uncharacterized protein n=2 Tax=Clavibacter michiganensis TaxID=28447 RepID=A0A2S5VS98_9MICO|nr:hypothetical protein C5E16_10910 [Clavibacter michiganensis]